MPISILFKIFIDKFKDEKLRSVIYICKFGIQSYCCNTRFIDSKENKTETVEHLIRCHLLEHLTKIKAGEYMILYLFICYNRSYFNYL